MPARADALRRLVANLSRHLIDDSLSRLERVKDVSHLEMGVTSPAALVSEDVAHRTGEGSACERDDETEHVSGLHSDGAGGENLREFVFRDDASESRCRDFHEGSCDDEVFEEHVVLWGWGVIISYLLAVIFAHITRFLPK